MSEKIKIIVTIQNNEHHPYSAHVEGKPYVKEDGVSRSEAIGSLIRAHGEVLNIEVVHVDSSLI